MFDKDNLVEHLKNNTRVLKSPNVIEAFKKIDRADFVDKGYITEAYGDYPLLIGYEQTISQPTTVAFMMELLSLENGHKVLDVGSGSGWTTALLAHIVKDNGRVFGVEKIPELVEFGKNNLAKYKFSNAEIIQATKDFDFLKEAPYDRILVSAEADELPHELVSQLKVGGVMVIPIDNSVFRITKISDKKVEKEEHKGFAFVPLVKN